MKISKRLAYRSIQGKIYIVDSKNSELHELDATASFIWRLIEKEQNFDEILKKILSEYEVNSEDAKNDLRNFIDELAAKKLIESDY